MSNVLIGIIGVILFIGLALAGALFLGSRFQDASNSSKAAAAVQAVSQVSSAYNLYYLQNGRPIGSVDALPGAGYLKAMPKNPVDPDDMVGFYESNRLTGTAPDQVRKTFIEMNIGMNRAVCQAINRQTTGSDTIPTNGDAVAATAGCREEPLSGIFVVYAAV